MPKGIPGRPQCKFPECAKPTDGGYGWCTGHYQQWKRGAELTPLRERWPRGLACSVCGKPAKSRGLCVAHYKKFLKYGDPKISKISSNYNGQLCAFENCDRIAKAKGLCNGHWGQQREGRPLVPIKPRNLPLAERLLAGRRVDANGCWLWTGYIDRDGDGYGRTSFGVGGRTRLVHRMAHELWVGPLGRQTVHHKCGVRACFNPDHLELATLRENALEMHERRSLRARIALLETRNRELEESQCHCHLRASPHRA